MKVKQTNPAIKIIVYAFLVFMSLVAIFPGIWMLSTSIKPTTELYAVPPRVIPDNPTLNNFLTVIKNEKMYTAFFNSVFITVSVVAITLFISVIAGYGLNRFRFKGSKLVTVALLFGQMVPGVVLIIPLYFAFSKLGLLDTRFAIILSNMALTIPMAVIMMSSFFVSVPFALEEAAMIDGTTQFQALFRVILPIAKPGLVSVTIYTFINAWEEFLFALNLSMSSKTHTLPIAIHSFAGEFTVDWGATMAAAAFIAFPVLLLFVIGNKYFVEGLSDGAVKG